MYIINYITTIKQDKKIVKVDFMNVSFGFFSESLTEFK